MRTLRSYADPVLTCQFSGEFEAGLLCDSEAEWSAMQAAGLGLANAVLRDYAELAEIPRDLRVLALVGKGHNGGDALLACDRILQAYADARVCLLLSASPDRIKPLARKAFDQLDGRAELLVLEGGESVAEIQSELARFSGGCDFHICLDGLLGFNFKPPLRAPIGNLIAAVNGFAGIRLRAAVDLPSGRGDVSDSQPFRADFTYATGIVKRALFEGNASCGRVRYLDLGFFADGDERSTSSEYVLTSRVLVPMQQLRPAEADKRTFGHLFIVGGSAGMPGALLMSVRAAVRSSVGLVTAFAPTSVVASLAAQVPEVMWVPWPETDTGTLSASGCELLWERLPRATAVLCGPGLGQGTDVSDLVQQIAVRVRQPLLLDADALQPELLVRLSERGEAFGPVILTPHMGEFMRMCGLVEPDYSSDSLREFSGRHRVLTVLKCAHTRICDGTNLVYNLSGGPVLSRGGSGDLLAGLIGGQLAQGFDSAFESAAQGVALHGAAAECLARAKGQRLVAAPQLLEHLPQVLREL